MDLSNISVECSEDLFDNMSYNFNEKAETAAKKKGMVVVSPKPNEIQIDIDSEEAYNLFEKRFENMDFGRTKYGSPLVIEKPSASGLPHRHITLVFDDNRDDDPVVFDESTRIALQCVLGSDPVREFLNMKRVIHGIENPTRLFEKP